MYKIIFYEDAQGNSDVLEYLETLEKEAATNKQSRIKRNKIVAYMDMLEKMGTRVGEPVTKHLTGEIWELRPLKNRILYAYYEDDKFIVLHHFVKKTQKTPKREIEKAIRNLSDYRERNK